VSGGTYLQISGAAFELAGIATVAFGIANTRAKFTDNAPLARRAWSRTARAAARLFRRKRSQTVHLGAATLHVRAGSVRARGTVGFGPWVDEELAERIERLRRAVENHNRELSELGGRLDGEEVARQEADERHEGHVDEVHRELTQLVRDAAAGGLRLETIGVALLAVGVVLQTWGNLVS